jgi:hypothetical protein
MCKLGASDWELDFQFKMASTRSPGYKIPTESTAFPSIG